MLRLSTPAPVLRFDDADPRVDRLTPRPSVSIASTPQAIDTGATARVTGNVTSSVTRTDYRRNPAGAARHAPGDTGAFVIG